MLKYFDKAFFHFLFGFAGILAVSFTVLVAVGFYDVEIKSQAKASEASEL